MLTKKKKNGGRTNEAYANENTPGNKMGPQQKQLEVGGRKKSSLGEITKLKPIDTAIYRIMTLSITGRDPLCKNGSGSWKHGQWYPGNGWFFHEHINRMPYGRSIVGKHHHPSSSSLLVTCSQNLVGNLEFPSQVSACCFKSF